MYSNVILLVPSRGYLNYFKFQWTISIPVRYFRPNCRQARVRFRRLHVTVSLKCKIKN